MPTCNPCPGGEEINPEAKAKKAIEFVKETPIIAYYSGTFPSKHSKCRSPFHGLTIRQNGDIEVCQGFIIGNIKILYQRYGNVQK